MVGYFSIYQHVLYRCSKNNFRFYKEKVMIYISLPYSHENKFVRKYREEIARIYFSTLVAEGKVATSPILTGCIAEQYINFDNVPYSFWMELSEAYIKSCTELHVIMLAGWRQSTGVIWEIQRAKELGIIVKYFTEAYGVNGEIPSFLECTEVPYGMF